MKVDISESTLARLRSLGKGSADEAVSFLLDKLAPKDEDVLDSIISAWNDIVVGKTQYRAPVNSAMFRADLAASISFIGRDWRELFEKMLGLRGLTESGKFSLNALVARRGEDERLIVRLASGAYDTWIDPSEPAGPKPSLETVLKGDAVPFDWLRPPAPIHEDTLGRFREKACSRYSGLASTAKPYLRAWLTWRRPSAAFWDNQVRGLLNEWR